MEFPLFQPPGTQPDAQSIMYQHFHTMTTFITQQVGAMLDVHDPISGEYA
ncbi:hypothetical protein J471_5204, partial [Acinetobacter baumannii 1032359]